MTRGHRCSYCCRPTVTSSKCRSRSSSEPVASGRFAKQEHCERWRAKRNWCQESKHRVRFRRPRPLRGITPPGNILRLYMDSLAIFFRQKIVRNAVHNAFLNTSTMETAFPRGQTTISATDYTISATGKSRFRPHVDIGHTIIVHRAHNVKSGVPSLTIVIGSHGNLEH